MMGMPGRGASLKREEIKCPLYVLHFCASEDVKQLEFLGLGLGGAEVEDMN